METSVLCVGSRSVILVNAVMYFLLTCVPRVVENLKIDNKHVGVSTRRC